MTDTATQSGVTDSAGRPIIQPVLHHFGTATTRHDEMVEWYRNVVGLEVVLRAGDPVPQMTFVTNDETHHRGGFFTPPFLEDDAERSKHARIQHLAWEYGSFDDLIQSWDRIRQLGIEPVLCTCHGPSFAFYYKDPDGSTVEILCDAYEEPGASLEYMGTPEMLANPMGILVDPSKLNEARTSGKSLTELREGAMAGEFLPAVQPPPLATW
jgi:catechol 2,3-dioxygenase